MKNFDLHRFGQTFKSQLLMGRNFWLKLFVIFFLVLFFAELIFTESMGSNVFGYYTTSVDNAVNFGTFFFVISMLFSATSIFSMLKDTRSRITYLMFPASNLEKYLNSLILSTVVVAIVTFAAFFCADTARTLMAPAFGHEMVWGVPSFISSLIPDSSYSLSAPDIDKVYQWWLGFFMEVGVILYFHSLYMLGGTAFRRQQFLITSMIIVCCMIIIVSILSHVDLGISITLMSYNEQEGLYVHPIVYPVIVGIYLLTCFNYWLSYRIFCRVQAVNNKWLNV